MAPQRIKVPCLGRQSGKSALLRRACLDGHGPIDAQGRPLYPGALRGATVWLVTKDYPTGTLLWRDIMGSTLKWGGELDVSKIERRIGFPGGGSLTLKSGSDPNAMRGPTLNGLGGDEMAFWAPDTLAALEPALMVRQAWRVEASSPYGENFYHAEWKKGDPRNPSRDPLYRSWQLPSSVSPLVSPEEFARIEANTNPIVFAREYRAEFKVQTGEIFQSEWFRYYTQDDLWIHPDLGKPVMKSHLRIFMSADFALTKQDYSDYTAIGVWGAAPDGRLFALDMTRGRYSAAEIPPLLKRIQDRWEATSVHVEKSGPLVTLNQECKVAGVRIVEHGIHHVVDGKKGWDKVSRARHGSAAVQMGRLMFPKVQHPDSSYSPPAWVEELVAECCSFPSKGIPDDRVDCLSWAVIASPNKSAPERRSGYERFGGDEDERPRESGWIIGRD